jgi:hypothetical protein
MVDEGESSCSSDSTSRAVAVKGSTASATQNSTARAAKDSTATADVNSQARYESVSVCP